MVSNFVQISTNQFHLPKKRPRKPETGIKDGFEEMEHEYSVRKNWTAYSNVPLLQKNFIWNEPKSRGLSNRIFRKHVVNGKQPLVDGPAGV